jgi:hypothetical protein
MDSFAGPQVEAGVMPRAADFILDDKPLGKRSLVMGAMGVYGKDVALEAYDQNILIANVTDQFAIGKFGKCNALRQIGS